MNAKWNRVAEGLLSGSIAEWVGFIAVVVAIAGAVWIVARYRESLHGDTDPAETDAELIRRIREMRDRGEVSETEFRSLKSQLRPSESDISPSADELRSRGPGNSGQR